MLVVDTTIKKPLAGRLQTLPIDVGVRARGFHCDTEDRLIAGAGTADARVLLYRQFGVDVRGVATEYGRHLDVYSRRNTEYRLVVLFTPMRVHLSCGYREKAVFVAMQLWAQVTRINVPTAGERLASSAVNARTS